MEITATMVKELRERTAASMMECKRALQENGGDIDAAIAAMRKAGLAKADKKAGRIAADGMIVIQQNAEAVAMLEINCETDFVAKGDDFKNFCYAVAATLLDARSSDVTTLLAAPYHNGKGHTVEEARRELIAKLGENINIRRFTLMYIEKPAHVGIYLHGTRFGALVNMQGGSPELAKDIAMHVVASRPLCLSAEQVPSEVIAKEKDIYLAQAAESGKPAHVIEKIVGNKLQKFLEEVTLIGQPFFKNPDQTVGKLLSTHAAKVTHFERFEVGEGIEKKTTNFAEEVQQLSSATKGA